MTANNGDTFGMGRAENVAPATAQAAASGQYTGKSASHACDRDQQQMSDAHKNQSIIYRTGQNGGN